MKKFLIAAAAIGTLGLSAAANAQVRTDYYGNPVTPPPGGTVIMEGRNTVVVPREDATRYVPEAYVNGMYGSPNIYQQNPGIEPYIAKQIEQDQKGRGN